MHIYKTSIVISLLALHGAAEGFLFAQGAEGNLSTQLISQSKTSATPVYFQSGADISQYTIPENPVLWGMDVAWDNVDNVRRGTNYIGKEHLAVGRVSFQPSDLVGDNDELSAAQKNALQRRLNHIAESGVKDLILNCDHEVLCNKDNYPNCDQNYANYYGKPAEWLKVIRASVKYCKAQGFNVVTISPFNEPDYTAWKEGTKAHFKEIARLISEDPYLQGIRISAGNTLNCDQASSWYEAVKPYATEGNTHQLAGSFDNYASFWQKVRNDGNYATADELHNVGEAFIGVHYGMQTGVWWGWDGAARGEYCRASRTGKEIGYGENRSAWSAATVYKRDNGRIDAFLGTSERQAATSSYEFVSTDHPAYFDGQGPYYCYTMTMPGGTGYQQGQINAERVFGIQYGADVPLDAIVPGKYMIMNAHSRLCMGTYDDSRNSGIIITQRRPGTSSKPAHQWTVEALPSGSGGDQGYFLLRWGLETNYLMDILNWSISPGGTFISYPGGKGANEQWFVEYAGDNSWYIRSRHSGLYVEVKSSSTSANASLQQAEFTGKDNQKWIFIPVEESLTIDKVAPAVPVGLTAKAESAAIKLSWEANTETDLRGYVVLRDGDVIARLITGTEFVDNDVRPGMIHRYAVKAVDRCRNQSEYSEEVEVELSEDPALIMHYTFEKDSIDQTINALNPKAGGKMVYTTTRKKEGTSSFSLSSTSKYLMLPPAVGYYDNMTMAMWVYISQLQSWQRIFDFGNGTDQYFFLTPSNGTDASLVFKNGGEEQKLNVAKIKAGGWHHIAVTLSPDSVTLYIDGVGTTTTDIQIRPSQFAPKHNYIGKSQFSADPLLTGCIDDLRFYNCPLSSEQIQMLMAGEEPVGMQAIESVSSPELSTIYTLDGRVVPAGAEPKGIMVRGGRKFVQL